MGAWIETLYLIDLRGLSEVAPSWVRELKHLNLNPLKIPKSRTFMGAWIETDYAAYAQNRMSRTFMGAWIETF